MKNQRPYHLIVFVFLCFQVHILVAQTPPYNGTIFIEPGIITDTDCSTLSSVTYIGKGNKTVYDRRVNNWVYINAYLFNVVWNDSLTSQAVINPEFTLTDATKEANKYGFKIGQLPYCLRTDVKEIWIHKGNFDWGGGNKSILIHTGRATIYENQGISEETLVHEASHTSLDASHAESSAWLNAQLLDNNFISSYAKQNPISEDIAESFLTWLAVRYFAHRISPSNYEIIKKTIPNRLKYFDTQDFKLNPIPCSTSTSAKLEEFKTFRVYPNPITNILYIDTPLTGSTSIDIYNSMGQRLENIKISDNQVDLSIYPNGLYLIFLRSNDNATTFKIIKNGR